jgi:hypothetical protein
MRIRNPVPGDCELEPLSVCVGAGLVQGYTPLVLVVILLHVSWIRNTSLTYLKVVASHSLCVRVQDWCRATLPWCWW